MPSVGKGSGPVDRDAEFDDCSLPYSGHQIRSPQMELTAEVRVDGELGTPGAKAGNEKTNPSPQ
jgi:hypothetical protein